MEEHCINYCVKGNCSNCGNCCTELIPLTITEVKLIKAYVKEKNIKPYSDVFFKYENKHSTNLMCPFRDFDNKKCKIYEVRPKICRLFKCNKSLKEIETHKNKAHNKANYNKCKNKNEPIYKVYSMRELIYEDKLDTLRIIVGNVLRVNKPINVESIEILMKNFGREDFTKDDINRVINEYKYYDNLARGDEE